MIIFVHKHKFNGKERLALGKIVLLVPREDMLYQAHNILQEKKFQIHEMRVVKTENIVSEARHSIADGASIIIARGLQASLIKQYTSIPVVELVMTAQEMALLVMRAKQIIGKNRPVIAVVGFKNMFCDMSYFDELYGIELRTYYAKAGAELQETADEAVSDDVDLVIGGDTAVSAASKAGIPSLFLSTTEDSMRQAFSVAESMEFAMNAEKKTAARMETLLDSSFSGVIQVDSEGVITSVNPLMEDILGKTEDELRGIVLARISPSLGGNSLKKVLEEGREYSMFVEWNKQPFFAVIAPVIYEQKAEGAIITCHRASKTSRETDYSSVLGNNRGEKRKKEKTVPSIQFEEFRYNSAAMQECIRKAGIYAFSDKPVVIRGEAGTEVEKIAVCIHNAGSRKEEVFLTNSCRGLSGIEQKECLFGEHGLVMQAKGGSLFIKNIEFMTLDNQYRLYQLIHNKYCYGTTPSCTGGANVRIIAEANKPLSELKKNKILIDELYYVFSGFELEIPPLRERKEDLKELLKENIKQCCNQYGHYHVLTSGAMEILEKYKWDGNILQLESFFNRLILMAGKRSIDEIAVTKLLNELYPDIDNIEDINDLQIKTESRESMEIKEKLILCGGNREETAKELGISKATLWRKMKKYNIK